MGVMVVRVSGTELPPARPILPLPGCLQESLASESKARCWGYSLGDTSGLAGACVSAGDGRDVFCTHLLLHFAREELEMILLMRR